MIWPFKKRYKSGGLVQPKPPAPCGEDAEHYFWVEDGWPCPLCAALETAKRERVREIAGQDELAERIANKVIKKLIEAGIV